MKMEPRLLIPNVIAIYTKKVAKPRTHKKHQVIVHKQGFYPEVYSSFDKKSEMMKEARKVIKNYKSNLKSQLK